MTACGNERLTAPGAVAIREHYITASPDESLRNCKERPAKRTVVDDVGVSTVITDFAEYGDDCKSKHDKTWKSIDDARARADRLNADQP